MVGENGEDDEVVPQEPADQMLRMESLVSSGDGDGGWGQQKGEDPE